jgi:hypothetical protein
MLSLLIAEFVYICAMVDIMDAETEILRRLDRIEDLHNSLPTKRLAGIILATLVIAALIVVISLR